jgi:hypothetical protein
MHTRFLTSVFGLLAGAFVVIASFAFATGTAAWIAFGIGLGLLVIAAVPPLFGERRLLGLTVDGVGAVLAIWTVVASVVFSDTVVRWLTFGEGVGFVALALGGLVLNQSRLTRPNHVAVPKHIGSTDETESSRLTSAAA